MEPEDTALIKSKWWNWKWILVFAVLIALATKGAVDIVDNIVNPSAPPVTDITKIEVNVGSDGTSSLEIRNVGVEEIKIGNKGSVEIVVSGDIIIPFDREPQP